MERLISLMGIFVMVGCCYLISEKRSKIVWKTVIVGIILQLFLGFIILKWSYGRLFFEYAKDLATSVLAFTNVGSDFIFGSLNNPNKVGFVVMTMVLPTIIFTSSLMSVLYYLGLMQKVVEAMARVMMKLMGTSGAESLAAAANIFAGQTEAPLVVKPYINGMTRSEIMCLMTGGMATVAGGVLAAYVGMGINAGHLLAASVMSAPAALVCAKLMVPEQQLPETVGKIEWEKKKEAVNVIDAAATGAAEGLKLALNVGAMIIAFVALVAMMNAMIGTIGGWFGFPELSFEGIMGFLFSPLALVMGIPWSESFQVGILLGKKTVINEFVAYIDLQALMKDGSLSERSVIISTYALCGFANFSSIAIQLGGIGTIAPKRKRDLAKLGMRSLIGGTFACLMTACVAGLFY